VANLVGRLKAELESPADLRRLGTGWLSGAGALACGLVGLLLIISLRYEGPLAMPDLEVLRTSPLFRVALHAILMFGYLLAMVSLLLRRDKLLGFAALGLIMTASLIGAGGAGKTEAGSATIYFGLDFFVLNVLFTGFLFVPLERFFPKHQAQSVFRPEWDEDMFYYLVSSLVVQVMTFLTLAPSQFISAHSNLTEVRTYIASQPFLLQLLLIMIVTDFAQYWLHRAFHAVPFLWHFHAVHHSTRTMDWLAGGRMHIMEVFVLRGFTAIPMLTLGFDPAAVQIYVLFVYFYSAFVHANIGWKFGALERFFVTPRFHHWHHGEEKEAIDVNFAIHFPLYDWLFGTYHMPEGRWPNGYGVGGHPVPGGYWRQLMYPFVRKG
jgi:sterol desaturase/sphingolipid hydroxylase (fatty acid hydroxylase superfamily)